MHSIVPLATLQRTPLAGAVAAVDLREALGGFPDFPEGTTRFVVTVDGTETADEIRSLEARRLPLHRKNFINSCSLNFVTIVIISRPAAASEGA